MGLVARLGATDERVGLFSNIYHAEENIEDFEENVEKEDDRNFLVQGGEKRGSHEHRDPADDIEDR